MRTSIIAIVFSLVALGLAGFASVTSLTNNEPLETAPVVIEATWSTAECEEARAALKTVLLRGCFGEASCAPYTDLLQAIIENCP